MAPNELERLDAVARESRRRRNKNDDQVLGSLKGGRAKRKEVHTNK